MEQNTLAEIANARGQLGGMIKTNAPLDDRVAAGNELIGSLGRLLVVLEIYPELKTSEHLLRLQSAVLDTENRLR